MLAHLGGASCDDAYKPLRSHTKQVHNRTKTAEIAVLYILISPVAARPKAWVCGRSHAVIVGFESPQGQGCLPLLSILYCRADHSSRGVLPSVVCLSVIVKPR